MYKIEWTPKALENLNKLEIDIARRIVKKVNNLRDNYDFMDIKYLKSLDCWKLRVGSYRVLFDRESAKLIILKVGHRKNIYDWKKHY